jgi:signal transduction histidine kinase
VCKTQRLAALVPGILLARMSRELRTPLNAIPGNSHLLGQEPALRLPGNAVKYTAAGLPH